MPLEEISAGIFHSVGRVFPTLLRLGELVDPVASLVGFGTLRLVSLGAYPSRRETLTEDLVCWLVGWAEIALVLGIIGWWLYPSS